VTETLSFWYEVKLVHFYSALKAQEHLIAK